MGEHTALLPCPFCGANVDLITSRRIGDEVFCDNCTARSPQGIWNARAATTAVSDLVWALQTILANTEEDAIPHISHDGMTAYQSLARDISDCASAALSRFRELEKAND